MLTKQEQTILVSAPSNAAADLLTIRLAEKGVHVVRVGNIGRVSEDILEHTLEVILSKHPDSKHIKKGVKQEEAAAVTKKKQKKVPPPFVSRYAL